MLLRTISIISVFLSALWLAGFSGCNKVDAFKCVLILVDDQGHKRPLDQWRWHCLNQKTQEEKEISILDSDKCIQDQSANCKWIGTDLREEEIMRKEYDKQCQPKS